MTTASNNPKIANPVKRGDLTSTDHIILIQCPIFIKKITRHTKNLTSSYHLILVQFPFFILRSYKHIWFIQKKKTQNKLVETISEEVQTLALPDKDVKITVLCSKN